MINWRTSRFILMSFLLNASVLAIAVWMMIDQDAVVAYVSSFFPAAGPQLSEEASPIPPSSNDTRQAVELPRYPVVHVMPRSVSVFDPAV